MAQAIINFNDKVLLEDTKILTRYVAPVVTTTTTTTLATWFTPDANTLRYYKMRDTTDSSGNSNTLTNTGSVTFDDSGATFDGSNYLIDTSMTSQSTNETIMCWFNFDTSSVGSFAIWNYMYPVPNFQANGVKIANAANLLYHVYQWSGSGYKNTSTAWGSYYNTWKFVATVKDGTTLKYYWGDETTTTLAATHTVGAITQTLKGLTLGMSWSASDGTTVTDYAEGSISGLIQTNDAWSQTDIETQAAKGRFDPTQYS